MPSWTGRSAAFFVASAVVALTMAQGLPAVASAHAASSRVSDEEAAAAGLLHTADLPPGWSQSPPTKSDTALPTIPECDGLRRMQAQRNVTKATSLFRPVAESRELVYETVTVAASAKVAQGDVHLLTTNPMLQCLVKGSVASVHGRNPLRGVTTHLRHLKVSPVGDGAAGIMLTTEVASTGRGRQHADPD